MGRPFNPPDTTVSSGAVRSYAGHLASGTMQSFFSSAICLPTGLLTAAFLTRQLGPVDYGLFTVATTLIVWIEGAITVAFGRSAVKFVTETENWQSVSTKFLQAQLLVALGATALLSAVSPILASWLDAPQMSLYLRIYSLGIPITALSRIHQSFLIGRGQFGHRAILPATYWLSRMLLIFLFVWLRPTVTCAILANIGAAVVVFSLARHFINPPILAHSDFPFRNLWDYAWPIFFYTVGMNLFSGLDLLFVKGLSGIPQAAGFYGAARNLTIVPSLFAFSFSPLLLAKLTHLQANDLEETAQVMTRYAMRLVFCLIPFAGMAAGAAPEVVAAIYGDPFLPAAPILALLIFGALGIVMITVTTSTFIAAGRPGLPIMLIGPFVAIAPIAHFLLVTQFGPIGAAAASTGLAWLAAGVCILTVFKTRGVLPPATTFFRSIAICGLAYAVAVLWPSSGVLLLIKLPVIGLIIVIAFLLLGEFRSKEIAFMRRLFNRHTATE